MNIKSGLVCLIASLFLTSCSVQGPKGEQGETGNGIISIVKTDNDGLIDTYTITYTDGTTSTFTVTNGSDGLQGIQGEKGEDGHTPIVNIGENGNWFIDGVDSGIKAGVDTKTFIVKYHLNGGNLPEGYSDTITVNQGDTLDLPIPTKEGYVFTGWYTGDTINDKQFSSSDGVFKNLDLYAQYDVEKDLITQENITYLLNYDTCEANIVKYNGIFDDNYDVDGDYIVIPKNIAFGNRRFEVKKILDRAFFIDNGRINNIILPETLTDIGEESFYYQNFKELILPTNLKSIGSAAFYRCEQLETIYIPPMIEFIATTTFDECPSLKSIVVDENNCFYDSRNNSNSLIETATNTLIKGSCNSMIPNSITSLGERAFSWMNYIPLIPDSVINIGEMCFYHNTGGRERLMLRNVEEIKSGAFYMCENIKSVVFGKNLKKIEDGAFNGCSNLKDVYYCGSEAERNSIEVDSFFNNTNITMHFNFEI